jgi:serine protease SohB
MLDPFQPENPEDVERLRSIQKVIHEDFIGLVKTSRGTRLSAPEQSLFSGEYWTGRTALAFGLIDRIGDLRSVLRERFGEEVVTPLIAPSRGLLGRLSSASEVFGPRIGLADDMVSAIETRALWSRYGL